ncbi:NADH-quinone oxidoreductase subunit B family protein [Sulfobacillus thermosulfidooxidans]|uniref:NADH-quinone oxidoreductase subunit B family protein n=1 Tax=Sulfobacillus thermosulfidooxidans TaxID=28034 RepID=UPI0006B603F0|nr:oxidoreductase [Sulfobacillus thermosulfidooxidans]
MNPMWRTLQARHVDAGSCNGCEQELTHLSNRVYDFQHLGLDIVASPRQADTLIVTGPVNDTMYLALHTVWEAVPSPKWLVAIGDCAAGCGVFQSAYASHGGVAKALRTPDVVVKGCPPEPRQILDALNQLRHKASGN